MMMIWVGVMAVAVLYIGVMYIVYDFFNTWWEDDRVKGTFEAEVMAFFWPISIPMYILICILGFFGGLIPFNLLRSGSQLAKFLKRQGGEYDK